MRLRACIALLLFISACATSAPSPEGPAERDPTLANLHRAATLPWTDEGQCAVREASQSWSVLVERCFPALDHDRIEFHDATGRCAVASVGAAAVGLGVCVLAAPEIVAGAVIITGVVVVGLALQEALDAYALRETSERERRPECVPIPLPRHLGGNDLHNQCADKMPGNSFPGGDVYVNGKNFDALQLATRTLWDVKTDGFDKHSPHSQKFFARIKLPELQREKRLAEACGYGFVVGVKSAAHKLALEQLDNTLKVVVMNWC